MATATPQTTATSMSKWTWPKALLLWICVGSFFMSLATSLAPSSFVCQRCWCTFSTTATMNRWRTVIITLKLSKVASFYCRQVLILHFFPYLEPEGGGREHIPGIGESWGDNASYSAFPCFWTYFDMFLKGWRRTRSKRCSPPAIFPHRRPIFR